MNLSIRRVLHAVIAGVGTAFVGILMAVGGVGLVVAALSTHRTRLRLVTACVLLIVGVVDLRSSFGIWREQPRPILLSVGATVGLLLYLGAALQDFGEIFWVNTILFVLLVTLRRRTSVPTLAV